MIRMSEQVFGKSNSYDEAEDCFSLKSPAAGLQRVESRRGSLMEADGCGKSGAVTEMPSPTSVKLLGSDSLHSSNKSNNTNTNNNTSSNSKYRIRSIQYPCLFVSPYDDEDESISVRRLRESIRCEGPACSCTSTCSGPTCTCTNDIVSAIHLEDFQLARQCAVRDGNLGEEAIACYALQEYSQAISCIQQALSHNHAQLTDSVLLYSILALTYFDMGQGLRARATFEEALQYCSCTSDHHLWQYATIQFNLAFIYSKQSDFTKALPLLEESLLLQQSVQLRYPQQKRRIQTTHQLLHSWHKAPPASSPHPHQHQHQHQHHQNIIHAPHWKPLEFLLPPTPLHSARDSPSLQLSYALSNCIIHDQHLNHIYQRSIAQTNTKTKHKTKHANHKDWTSNKCLEDLTHLLETPTDIHPSRVYLCIGLVHLHCKHITLAQKSFQKSIGLANDATDDNENNIQDLYLKSLAFLWLGLSYLANDNDDDTTTSTTTNDNNEKKKQEYTYLALEACSNSLNLRRAKWGYTHNLALTALYHVGLCHLCLGGYVAARKAMEEIMEVNPNEVQVLVTMGCIHHYAQNPTDAICTFEKALSLERKHGTNDSLALENLAYCMAIQSQSDTVNNQHHHDHDDDDSWRDRMSAYREMLSMY